MNDGHIAKRYAQALIDYATANGEDERLYRQMKSLSEMLTTMPHLKTTLVNPMVAPSDKLQLLRSAVGDETGESFHRFAQLVLDNKRESLLTNIALNYISLYRKIHRIGKVVLISVDPLPAAITDRILQNLIAKTYRAVELENRIDKNIKGGFILQIDDWRLDASVAGQLEKIRRQFIRKNKMIV
ncbi:MAG: F0F1 ATP synthase subunit delta [Prevotellaceae bacterium]|jgi:F-type H+-transporting ATPase subunit delta|nr:F0F1 ATP synthase subunit delta [Prevotellaceae bacterium]